MKFVRRKFLKLLKKMLLPYKNLMPTSQAEWYTGRTSRYGRRPSSRPGATGSPVSRSARASCSRAPANCATLGSCSCPSNNSFSMLSYLWRKHTRLLFGIKWFERFQRKRRASKHVRDDLWYRVNSLIEVEHSFFVDKIIHTKSVDLVRL